MEGTLLTELSSFKILNSGVCTRFDAYTQASKPFVIHQVALTNAADAASQIDEAITTCITKARPVYLALPTDMVLQKVSTERLSIPLSRTQPPNDPQTEEYVVDQIYQLVKEAEGDVVVLVDACVVRHDVKKEVAQLLKETGFPVYAAPMGKTAVDENNPRYGGVSSSPLYSRKCLLLIRLLLLQIYIGSLTDPAVKEAVEGAKLVLSIGSLLSDFNTGNFSYNITTRHNIEVRRHDSDQVVTGTKMTPFSSFP